MGMLRTLLALSVVAFHSGPIFGVHLPDGILAVQVFYVTSGFYMALILSTIYVNRNRDFYVNRALRIFPMYWMIASYTLVGFVLIGAPTIRNFVGLLPERPIAATWVVFSNVAIFGLDWNSFVNIGGEPAKGFNIVRTAWTLGLELTFYAMAPFLLRVKSLYLIGIIGASFAARFWAYSQGLDRDPWSYQFFPFELAFFLTGIVLYRAQSRLFDRVSETMIRRLGIAAVVAAVIVVFHQPFILSNSSVVWPFGNIGRWLSIAILSATLPFLFNWTASSKLDSTIGEYSYPIYICHFSFIHFFPDFLNESPLGEGATLALLSIAMAQGLLTATRQIDRIRERVRRRGDALQKPEMSTSYAAAKSEPNNFASVAKARNVTLETKRASDIALSFLAGSAVAIFGRIVLLSNTGAPPPISMEWNDLSQWRANNLRLEKTDKSAPSGAKATRLIEDSQNTWRNAYIVVDDALSGQVAKVAAEINFDAKKRQIVLMVYAGRDRLSCNLRPDSSKTAMLLLRNAVAEVCTATRLGDGWWRLELTGSLSRTIADDPVFVAVAMTIDGFEESYQGDGTSGVMIGQVTWEQLHR